MKIYSEKMIFFLSFISVFANETIGYTTYGIYFVLIQTILIFYYLIKNNYIKSLYLFLIFSFTALEFPADLRNRPEIYTFRTVSIFGVSLFTINTAYGDWRINKDILLFHKNGFGIKEKNKIKYELNGYNIDKSKKLH